MKTKDDKTFQPSRKFYVALKNLSLFTPGKFCKVGSPVPLDYRRMHDALKRGWVREVSEREHQALIDERERLRAIKKKKADAVRTKRKGPLDPFGSGRTFRV